MTKQELEKEYGKVYDTDQLQENFIVHSFCYGLTKVTRKSDNKRGFMDFQHMPRFYFNFK